MSQNLMVTISGVRAVTGDTLSPELIVKYCSAFAHLINGKKIVIGNDSRISGPFVKRIAIGTFLAMGYEIIDIGLCPTPTVQFITEQYGADCGIVITASHNPIEWNGLKFIENTGLFLAPNKCEDMFKLADKNNFKSVKWEKLGHYSEDNTAIDKHIKAIIDLKFINEKKDKK